jgi:hypothetical protein
MPPLPHLYKLAPDEAAWLHSRACHCNTTARVVFVGGGASRWILTEAPPASLSDLLPLDLERDAEPVSRSEY